MDQEVQKDGRILGKLLRVNLTTREVSVEAIDPNDYLQFLGGRGLGAAWYWREVAPDFGRWIFENKIAFSPAR